MAWVSVANLRGATGPTGETGETGPTGVSAYTQSTAAFTVPDIGQTADVTLEDASWIVEGQTVWISGAAGANGEAGALVVTAKSGDTVTLLNPEPVGVGPTGPPGANGIEGPPGPTGPVIPVGFQSLDAATQLASEDRGKYFICAGGSWTLQLPEAIAGTSFFIRNDMGIVGSTGTIIVEPEGSATINGKTSLALLPQQECVITTDGTNWRTFGLQREVVLGEIEIDDLGLNWSPTILLPRGFRSFEIIWDEVRTASSAWLQMQPSTDGGATWLNTGHQRGYIINGSATTMATVAELNQPAVWTTLTQNATWRAQGTSLIFPGRPANGHVQTINGTHNTGWGTYQSITSGIFSNLTPINAIRLSSLVNVNSVRATVKGMA